MVKYFYHFENGGVLGMLQGQKEHALCIKTIRQETALLMQKNSTLPCLTSAFLFCLLIAGAAYCLIELAVYITGRLVTSLTAAVITEIVLIVCGILLFLSTLMPLWLAKLRMAGLLWQEQEPLSQEIFYYFTSFSRYRRAWRTGAVAVLLFALPVAAVIGSFSGALHLYSEVLSIYFSAPVAVLLLILLLLLAIVISVGVLFFGGIYIAFAAVAVGNEQLKLRVAFVLAVRAGKRHIKEIFVFSLRSLLWLALSLLTVGVLFVLWFSHFYNLSYMRLSMALVSLESESIDSCGIKEETV